MARRRLPMLEAVCCMMFMVEIGQVESQMITCPENKSANSGTASSIQFSWPDDPEANRTCDSVSGSMFDVGTTTVRCTNDDSQMDMCSFTITLRDTGVPRVSNCPGRKLISTSSGLNTSSTTWSVTATDNGPLKTLPVTCDHQSGSAFPIGDTTVECEATDAAGNMAICQFHVIVTDSEAPVFDTGSCPGTIRKTADIPDSGVPPTSIRVTWEEPTATDNAAGNVVLSSSHRPGAEFELGTTPVTYNATDAYGNTNQDGCSFNVQIGAQVPAKHIIAESITKASNNPCLSVKWPASRDNPEREYLISYWKEQGEGKSSFRQEVFHLPSSSQLNTPTTYEGPVEICRLSPGELYTVEVGGATVQHWTKPVVPGDVVKVVPGTLSCTSVEVTWTPVTLRNVEQYGVTLSYRGMIPPKVRDLGYFTKTTTRIKVDSLSPKTDYTVHVRAVVGSGSMRVETAFPLETFTTGQLQRSDLIAFNYTESTIEVAWISVSSLASTKDPNMLFIEPKDAVKNYLTFPDTRNPATALFEGLQPNTEYHIRLISNLGLSLSTTQKTRPSPVNNLRATVVLANSITVEWNSPADGDVDFYKIYISPGKDSMPTNVSSTSFTFSSLTSKTEYFIRVVLIYDGAESVPRTTLVTPGVTPPAPPAPLNVIAIIVGGVLGAIAFCLIVAIIITCVKYRRMKKVRRPDGMYERRVGPPAGQPRSYVSRVNRTLPDHDYVNTSIASRITGTLFRTRRHNAQQRAPAPLPRPGGSEYEMPNING